jgi:hypothetical protein
MVMRQITPEHYHTRWHALHHSSRGHIMDHNGAGADYRSIADSHTIQHDNPIP